MTAIVTTDFRVLNAENFKEDVAAGGMYLGIGKPDVWSTSMSDTTDTTPFTPYDNLENKHEAWKNMLGLKKLQASDITHVVPRHSWTTGNSYTAWDSDQADIYDNPFYVITNEFKVYKCIVKGASVSTQQPTQTNTAPTAESDGYVWKYMFTVSVSDAEKFLTLSYIPVKTVSLAFNNDAAAESALSEGDYAQYLNQKASRDHAKAAGIERIEVTAGGQNYHANDVFTVAFTGDGSGAAVADAGVTVDGNGAITALALTDKGTDYSVADITITHNNASGGTAGTGATARAVIAPKGGHGVDPVTELGAFYIGLNTLLGGTDNTDLVIGQDFRQVSLIKNPYNFGTTTVSTDTTLRATKHLLIASGQNTNGFVVDAILTGGTSGAKAFLAEIDATAGKLYYHQNSKTGYTPFQNGETVTGVGGGSATLHSGTALGSAEVANNSGQMIFLENRTPINRSSSQIEDIKVIIEF